ncbi:MAG: NfeD family protein [Clostridia bacterium]|nr:NfeD family protein [Clostridia bacterium]
MVEYALCLLWLVVLVVCIIFEVRTSDVVTVWFMPAAAVALLISFFAKEESDFWIQFAAFALVSIVSFLIFKIAFNKKVKKMKRGKTNLTALIGERCLVVEDISNIHSKGTVNLKGAIWSARSTDENDVVEEGTIVVVERIDGVKLVCSREK